MDAIKRKNISLDALMATTETSASAVTSYAKLQCAAMSPACVRQAGNRESITTLFNSFRSITA